MIREKSSGVFYGHRPERWGEKMEKKHEELQKEMITAIENAISNLTASDWDVETCRKLCCPERGDGGPATEDSFFFEEDLLSRLRLIEKGLMGISDDMSDTANTLKGLLPEEVTA